MRKASGKKVLQAPPEEQVVPTNTEVEECDGGIPDNLLKAFVGQVEDLLKIDQQKLYHGRYRVNVWTQKWPQGAYCPTNRIVKAYFVVYENGKILDKTR